MAGFTAVYVDSDTFTVTSDRTSDFIVGRRVKANCGADGYKYGTVESSSYSSPNTTVNLVDTNDDLTSNLAEVWYGSVKPGSAGNISRHDHDDDEGDGGNINALSHDIDEHGDTTATGAELETLTGGGDTTLHDHAGISENTSARHAASHNIASHSDTSATGAELETLTNNSVANTLHRHTELVASDGSPDPALSVGAAGDVDIGLNTYAGTRTLTLHTDNDNDTCIRFEDGTPSNGGFIYYDGSVNVLKLGTRVTNVDSTAFQIARTGNKVLLLNGTGINEFSTDDTLAGDSDDAVPTEQAVKAYVDANTGARSYVKVSDTKANATNGGDFTTGAWRTRVLNIEDSDTDGVCSLSSNQITLTAGTYECRITAPALRAHDHKAKLRNVTGSSDILIGTSEFSNSANAYAQTISVIVGKFTIAASQALEVQHYCGVTALTTGFGYSSGFGVSEVYTVAEFWKVG